MLLACSGDDVNERGVGSGVGNGTGGAGAGSGSLGIGGRAGAPAGAGGAAGSCGDGKRDPGEGCDDGNLLDTDACTNARQLATCGDGFTQADEECDDANAINTDNCTNACKNAKCGDGIKQVGEACDDGNQLAKDLCSLDCKERSGITLGYNCSLDGAVVEVIPVEPGCTNLEGIAAAQTSRVDFPSGAPVGMTVTLYDAADCAAKNRELLRSPAARAALALALRARRGALRRCLRCQHR